MQSWNFQREDNKKIAYLTFDDGPSENVTPQILDILDKNDVKATFFVLGTAIEGGEKQKELLRRMDEEEHAIGNHGYSHNYKILYPNGEVQYLCKLLPTPLDLFGRRFIPFKAFQEKRNAWYEMHWSGYEKVMEVPSLSGCFMFIRTDILKRIGGLMNASLCTPKIWTYVAG